MNTKVTPWGKILVILLISAGVMGLFFWKYQNTLADAEGELVHLPPILRPFYNALGVEMWLVFGAVAALLFAGVSIKAVMGTRHFDDE